MNDYNHGDTNLMKHLMCFAIALVGGGCLLASPLGRAVTTTNITDDITVTVDSSCMLSANVTSEHTATIYPGQSKSDIGTTSIKAFCNDADGYTLYVKAVNTTNLTSTSSDYTISTGLAMSGNVSSWAMKLTPDGTTYRPTLGSHFTDTPTTDASGYSIVPGDYQEAASFSGPTDNVIGSVVNATYRVYISPSQPAGVYTGSLIYKLVHPKGTPAERTINTITYMQEMDAEIKATMTEDQTYTLTDKRDNKTYTIAKLKDGKVWMTQNLALGGSTAINLTPADTNLAEGENFILPVAQTSGSNSWNDQARSGARYVNGAEVTTGTNYDSNHVFSNGANGNYYTHWTATAGSNGALTNDGDNAQSSICPKGWRLPVGGYDGNEFEPLLSQYGYADYEMDVATFTGEPLSFAFSGDYYDGVGLVGIVGSWWSSTVGGGSVAYHLDGNSDGSVYPDSYGNRYRGNSVRCVLGSSTSPTNPSKDSPEEPQQPTPKQSQTPPVTTSSPLAMSSPSSFTSSTPSNQSANQTKNTTQKNTTQSSDGATVPLGESSKTDIVNYRRDSGILLILIIIAVLAATGVLIFLLMKRRDDDEEEEEKA